MLAKIILRAGFKAINAVAEKDLVGVKSEDLLLAEAAFDLQRQHGFLHLARERAVGGEEQIARQLHGERGCALLHASASNIAISRAQDAPEIHSGVLFEFLVLDRQNGIAQDFRKILIT